MKERLYKMLEHWNQRNTDYYLETFRTLEKGNKATFNFAAAFGTVTWLIFRKMYRLAILITLIWGGIQVFLQTFLRSPSTTISIAFSLILFVGFGFFGNGLYYDAVKSRVAKGYAKMAEHNPTDPVWGLIIVGFLVPACIGMIIPLLVFTKIISSSAMSIFSLLIQIFFMAIAWIVDYKKFRLRESIKPVRITWKSVDQYLRKSDSKRMFTAVCVWISGLILVLLSSILSVLVVGNKTKNQITNEMNQIIEKVDKMPSDSEKLRNVTQYDKNSRPSIDEENYLKH